MRVYVVRHGQSTSNLLENHQGSDCVLTPQGIQQAERLAARVAELPCDVIISSDYTRAVETTNIIKTKLIREHVTTPLLREEKDPREIEGVHKSDPEVLRIQALRYEHRNNPDWHFSDEENFFELRKRMQKCLQFLEQRTEQNILIVGHTMSLRMLASIVLFGEQLTPDLYLDMRKNMLLRHTGISIFDFDGATWKLVAWNDHAHLAE